MPKPQTNFTVHPAPRPDTDFRCLKLTMRKGQYAIVRLAMAKVMTAEDVSEAQALEWVCAEFLAGH